MKHINNYLLISFDFFSGDHFISFFYRIEEYDLHVYFIFFIILKVISKYSKRGMKKINLYKTFKFLVHIKALQLTSPFFLLHELKSIHVQGIGTGEFVADYISAI